jgi:hypothetical protein
MQYMLFRQLGVLARTMIGLALFHIAFPPTAEGQEGIVVTLDRGFIERIIERNMQEAMDEDPRLEHLRWRGHPRVVVQRDSRTALSVHLRLSYRIPGPNPPVDAHFRLGFTCWWRDPSLIPVVSNVDVKARAPWIYRLRFPISSVITEIIIGKRVAEHSRDLQSELSSRVRARVRAEGSADGPFKHCPNIEVTRQANVEVQFVSGLECRAGQDRHSSCPTNYFGPGFDYGCINGYWEQVGGWCEPSAPPGGRRP